MEVTSSNYVGLAVRTDNSYDDAVKDRFCNPAFIKSLHHLMKIVSSAGELSDLNKRYAFYGANTYAPASAGPVDKRLKEFYTPEVLSRVTERSFMRILHSTIGLITEVGELTDILFDYLFEGKEIDFEHIKEEYGDKFWYLAIGLDELGMSMEHVLGANINKLVARYPQGFNETDAVHRDLNAEKTAMLDTPKEESAANIVTDALDKAISDTNYVATGAEIYNALQFTPEGAPTSKVCVVTLTHKDMIGNQDKVEFPIPEAEKLQYMFALCRLGLDYGEAKQIVDGGDATLKVWLGAAYRTTDPNSYNSDPQTQA